MSRPGLWTEFGVCLHCKRDFDVTSCLPISLDCGHTLCKPCLLSLNSEKKLCPLDSKDVITTSMLRFPVNLALLTASVSSQIDRTKLLDDSVELSFNTPKERDAFLGCSIILEKFSLHLKSSKTGSNSTLNQVTKEMSSCAYINSSGTVTLSRPMQKKLLSLITCQMATSSGRERMGRCVKSLGERCITELILQHQHPHLLSGNLWGAVRSRGCQFLGPAMQEEVIRLILMALEDGSALSRKVLVLFVVQRLQEKYPQASKTAIGHVVQLLYRASCFKVMKRENESSLMQLKEEYCKYDHLRYEHDKQIVQIAHEAGLRIAPDQWSSLLYGDMYHKSKMQSIIDRLQTPQSFKQSISEFLIALGRTNDPASVCSLKEPLLHIATLTEAGISSIELVLRCLQPMERVLDALTLFVRDHCHDKLNFGTIAHTKYKTSICRDLKAKGTCPRGPTCTFAHNEEGEEAIDRGGGCTLDDGVSNTDTPELPVTLKPRAVVSPTARVQTPSEVQWQNRTPTLHANSGYYQPGPPSELSPTELVISPQMQNMPAAGYYHQVPVTPANLPRVPSHQGMPVLPHSPLSPSGYMSMGAGASDIAIVPAHPYQPYFPQQPHNYYNYYERSQQYPPPHSPRSYYPTHQIPEDHFYEQSRQLPGQVYPPADHPGAYQRAPADHPGAYQRAPADHPGAYQRAPADHPAAYQRAPADHPAAYQRAPADHPAAYQRATADHQAAYQRALAEAHHRALVEAHQRSPVEAHQRPPVEAHQRPPTAYERRQVERHSEDHPDESMQDAPAAPVTSTGTPSAGAAADDMLVTDSENLYEYQTHSSDGTSQTLATLRIRRRELLDKIQSHQQPLERDDTMKTEISRARIEDLARSLAVSMNVGAQEEDLHTTFVNSMLSAANLAPISDSVSAASADGQEMDKLAKWWKLSTDGARSEDSAHTQGVVKPGVLYNSLSRAGSGACHPPSSIAGSEEQPVWTSLSGLTSVVEWTGLRRSLSEKETLSDPIDLPSKFSRSVSHSAPESESMIPWSDQPLISMFGPISRGARVEVARADARAGTQPPISAELDTDVKDKLPIQVSASNTLTMTAVTPVKRPIPSPSLAHSKFTALPDNLHGFTLTAADMEGSSSIAESEQLRQELKILNYKIGKAEAQAASDELTDLERSIKRLETGVKCTSGGTYSSS